MDIIFSQNIEPDIFLPSGWNGTDIVCKQRTGQRSMLLSKEVTITVPDKVDAKWYALLNGKLAGMNMQHVKHEIRVFDRTVFLQDGYKRMLAEQGLQFNVLTINPNIINFPAHLGRAILAYKKLAKDYLNGF